MKVAQEKNDQHRPVAIIGMSCFFPKSQGLKEYWRLLYNGIDAITDVPESHWSPEDYFNADPHKPDHIYAQRGGFLSPIDFDPSEFGIPPSSLEATDSSQLFGLVAAKMALKDAGYCGKRQFNREKTSVILGVTGTQELVIPLGARLGHPHWRRALADAGIPSAQSEEIIERISDSYVSWQESSFPGLLGNVVAGRISNRLDLGGTNCVVDAACASSLSAVHLAIMELISGHSDMVITGGVDTLNDIFMHTCFSKSQLLSPTGDVRPFSKNADGTLLGEGVGILVLKRLADAEKDGDRIYAVIKALGSSSDGKSQSIYAPRREGQVKALRMAYRLADVAPDTVELVEAHGTGTRVGDQTEFQTLKELFSPPRDPERGPEGEGTFGAGSTCCLGSVKSMIGHTKAAAGSAGIIKSALALYNKVLPPTLKAETPDPGLAIGESPFYLNTQSRPWLSNQHHPRRSGVSSFGFGGSNFHAVLEEYKPQKERISWNGSVEIVALCADTPKDLHQQLSSWSQTLDRGVTAVEIARKAASSRETFNASASFRLLMAVNLSAPSTETLSKLFKKTINDLRENREQYAWQDKNTLSGTFYGRGEKPGDLAFIFPGQGSQYVDMGRDLACNFPQVLNAFEKINAYFKGPGRLSDYIFPINTREKKARQIQEQKLRQTDVAQPAIGAMSIGLLDLLVYFGLYPDTTCGHSYGELSALYAAGRIDLDDMAFLSVSRGRFMADAAGGANRANGAMLAVRAPMQELSALIDASGVDVILANKNSPAQGVLSGSLEGIAQAEKLCKAQKFRTLRLPVAAAFHSRLVKDAQIPFQKALARVTYRSTGIPVFSNTTGRPYPRGAEEAKKLLADQILCPVDFLSTIENMYAQGVGAFVEVGPKAVLTGLVKAILKGRQFHALATDGSAGKKSGVFDLAGALCRIAALGYPVTLSRWDPLQQPAASKKPVMNIPINGSNYRKSRATQEDRRSQAVKNREDINPFNKSNPETIPTPDILYAEKTEAANSPSIKNIGPHTASPSKRQHTQPYAPAAPEALAVIQQGLKSIQALQQQTTEAHKLFLTTQTETNRTLQKMMESARQTVETSPDQRLSTPPERHTIVADLAEEEGAAIQRSADMPSDSVLPDPVPSSPVPSDPLLSSDMIQTGLIEVVSELTGYPREMIGLDMDIEADLGIDSIKRVEILSNLEEKFPSLPSVSPEAMGSLKTLKQIVHHLSSADGGEIQGSPHPVSVGGEERPRTGGAPRAATMQGKTEIEEALMAVVSELTGYPVEMLNPDMDMEADLGIDSIKRVEILSSLEERNPDLPSVAPEVLGTLKTLGHIARHLAGEEPVRKPTANETRPTTAVPRDTLPLAELEQPTTATQPIGEAALDSISRSIVTVTEGSCPPGPPLQLPADAGVFITDDRTGLAEAVRDELLRRGITGIISKGSEAPPETESLGGLIIIPDPQEKCTREFLKEAFLLAKRCGPRLRASAQKGGAFLATITRLDGAFGFRGEHLKDSLQGALSGVAKTAAIEWEHVLCRAIDIDPRLRDHGHVAAMIVHDLLNGDPQGPVEMGYFEPSDRRMIPTLQPAAFPDGDVELEAGDVVVITGGARGVTASAAIALATQVNGINLALLGRSRAPFSEPIWLRALQKESEIKKAIHTHEFSADQVSLQKIESAFQKYMINREIEQHLAQLQRAGAHVTYYPVDCCNTDAVVDIIHTIRDTQQGPIRGVIHGAGVIADRLILEKTPEQFQQVLSTKIQGALNLLEATRPDPLKYLVFFSSVAARMGNQGQVDYAMANEGLNKIARREALMRPDCRVKSINWGPWEGGMVSDALKREFTKRDIALIPLQSGGLCMVHELMDTKSGSVEVVIGSRVHAETAPNNVKMLPTTTGSPHPPGEADTFFLAFKSKITLDRYPVLTSHVLDGTPVVPLALMMEWFGHSALHANPGLVFQGFDDLRLLAGIRVCRGDESIRLMADRPCKSESAYHVNLEIRNGNIQGRSDKKRMIHARTRAVLADTLDEAPLFDKSSHIKPTPYTRGMHAVYDKILFHGERLQGIRKIISFSDHAMVAEISPAPLPEKWVAAPLRSRWISDPLVLDGAFQMASLWCYESRGMVSLPSYSAAYRQYCRRFPNEPVTVVLDVREVTRHKMLGDFTFLSADDTVIAQLSGYEAIMDASLFKAFKPQSAA